MDENTPALLASAGIDADLLQSTPRGGHGKEWPSIWRAACEVLFTSGLTAGEVSRQLSGPDRRTVYAWAKVGGWLAKRNTHVQGVTQNALGKAAESQAEVLARQVAGLRLIQDAALGAVVKREVHLKTLEGATLSLISAIQEERRILGLDEAPGAVVQDNRTQTFVGFNAPPEDLQRVFELYRERFAIDDELERLDSPDSTPDME